MKKGFGLICCLAWGLCLASCGHKPMKVVLEPLPMQYGDTSISREYPFAKDPTVIHQGDRYLMYYSLTEFDPAPDNSKPPKFDAWHSAIATSQDLVNWTRVGDLDLRDSQGNPLRGAVAPCVRKLDGTIHMFYQMAWDGTDGVILELYDSANRRPGRSSGGYRGGRWFRFLRGSPGNARAPLFPRAG